MSSVQQLSHQVEILKQENQSAIALAAVFENEKVYYERYYMSMHRTIVLANFSKSTTFLLTFYSLRTLS